MDRTIYIRVLAVPTACVVREKHTYLLSCEKKITDIRLGLQQATLSKYLLLYQPHQIQTISDTHYLHLCNQHQWLIIQFTHPTFLTLYIRNKNWKYNFRKCPSFLLVWRQILYWLCSSEIKIQSSINNFNENKWENYYILQSGFRLSELILTPVLTRTKCCDSVFIILSVLWSSKKLRYVGCLFVPSDLLRFSFCHSFGHFLLTLGIHHSSSLPLSSSSWRYLWVLSS